METPARAGHACPRADLAYWTGWKTSRVTWQERWLASGADGRRHGLEADAGRMAARPRPRSSGSEAKLPAALGVAISADLIRPVTELAGGRGLPARVALVRDLAGTRDPEGFTRLRDTAATRDPRHLRQPHGTMTLQRTAADHRRPKAAALTEITVGDVLELLDAEAERAGGAEPATAPVFYRLLHADRGTRRTGARRRLREFRTPRASAHRTS